MAKQTTGSSGTVTAADVIAALERPSQKAHLPERLALLGIPLAEITESVALALSALFEKLDDVSHELAQTRENLNELEHLVDVDCVAPIPNRRAFMRRLDWVVSMHKRYGHPCSILYFDVNNFKAINDTYGHAAGDAAIRHMSKVFIESLRGSDFLARLGGDEFAVIMYYAGLEAAHDRGKKLSARIARTPFLWNGVKVLITAAFGAYQLTKGDDSEIALSNADTAMYLDKKRLKARMTDVSA